jgi:hypothetical protein
MMPKIMIGTWYVVAVCDDTNTRYFQEKNAEGNPFGPVIIIDSHVETMKVGEALSASLIVGDTQKYIIHGHFL